MNVRLHPSSLRREMTRRGFSAADLADAANLSPPTVTAALAGRPISASSLQRIAAALARSPIVQMIDTLLGTDGDPGIGVS